MKKISGFDLGAIIAAVVIALLGGGAWWYLSGNLQVAMADLTSAKGEFDRYSVAKNGQESILVSRSNQKALQAHIDLLRSQLGPLIENKLLPKDSEFRSIEKEDPVTWKHDLDDQVSRLKTAAKQHAVTIPANFHFGFSRYANQSPNDEQTLVLRKQMVGIDKITSILLAAPIKALDDIRRTYEEDPHTAASAAAAVPTTESDRIGGYAVAAPGGTYIAYPFEFDFDVSPENLRVVLDGLIQSPYIFVVRSLSVESSAPNSPMVTDLDNLAGTTPGSITSPGDVAATASTKGPQFLFGNAFLKVKARIDMIEWTGTDLGADSGSVTNPSGGKNPSPAKGP